MDSLTPEEQEQAKTNYELASQSKYYEMACLAYNKHVYDAMKLDRRLWEPFVCGQLGFHGSLVPIRECLIQLSKDWSLLDLHGDCPFQITENERTTHEKQKSKYEDTLYLWDLVKSQLHTDNSGWVPHSRWEITAQANKELFEMYLETMSEELTPEAARRTWPFPPPQD
ncbi:hypothetical protein ASPCAL04879 [Aspergillus calidoustus]|uniref:Uncharacterized protein n=1 Tax=Aspergillus calidoustus TaxID=454130 RepID=A0A0U4Z276_ASPCI|nr:hypothetical protein ASPCAL04879 [Aspergillus calidoustus]